MKKITKLLGGGLAIAALFLASCNGAVTPISSDTVVDLDTPAIYAKAYPGVNIVSWEPVSAASGYDIYRYENDNLSNLNIKTSVTFAQGIYTFEDTSIQNDVKYTYKIMAKGNLRAVSTKDSKLGSVTVTGIVPPKDVSALNLAAYEGGYNGKDAKELSDDEKNNKLLNAEKTKIYYNNGKVNVSFPAKAYLKYTVVISEGDEYAVTKVEPTGTAITTVDNNSILSSDTLNTTKAGTHGVYIKVESKNAAFHNYEFIRVGEVKNETLILDGMHDGTAAWNSSNYSAWDTAAGSQISSEYIDAGKTVRIKFRAPKLQSTHAPVPTSYIKIYRDTNDNPGLKPVELTVNSYVSLYKTDTTSWWDGDEETWYYVDDKTIESSGSYRYVVVVTDGNGKFAPKPAETKIYGYSTGYATGVTVGGSAITLDNDAKANDVRWTITLPNTTTTIKGVYSLVWDSKTNGAPAVNDFDKTKALTPKLAYGNTNSLSYYVYEKNLTDGKAYLLVEYSQPNKNDNFVISSKVDVSNTVAPELKGITGVSVSAGSPTALDTDKKANDIKWTVTMPNTYTTFKAYLLTRDKVGTNAAPVDVAEFDTTTPLTAVTEDNVALTTYYIYTKDIAAEKYAYLLVVASRTGYVDNYTVSSASSQISAIPSLSNGMTLTINNAYDNSTTLATPTTAVAKNNDLIINLSETITEATDSISNYTYKLYRTTSTVAADMSASTPTITFKHNTADWKEIATLTMNKSAAYNVAAPSNSYVGVYKDADLADGVYAYKVIKSNGVASVSTAIQYKKITANETVNGIQFTPSISASWKTVASPVAKNDIEITWTKNNTNNFVYTSGYLTGLKDEVVEEGVTYTLWRRVSENSETETVFTKVAATAEKTAVTATATKGTYANGTYTPDATATTYNDSLNYKFTDTNLSTGKSYQYIVVASKANVEDKISNITSLVSGSN